MSCHNGFRDGGVGASIRGHEGPESVLVLAFGPGHFTVRSDLNTVPFVSGLKISATTATTAPRMVP